MITAGHPWAWRGAPRGPLARALLLSLAIHLLAWGLWEAGHTRGWWARESLPSWLRFNPVRRAVERAVLAQPPRPLASDREPPMLFVDVDPALVVPDPPKDAKYYSSASTLAANPNPSANTETPKIEGTQTQVPKTFDTLTPVPTPPATPPPAEPAPPALARVNPEPPVTTPAVLAPETPAPNRPEPGDDPPPRPKPTATPNAPDPSAPGRVVPPSNRPRTIQEAMARKGMIQGRTMRQEGGVDRRGDVSLTVLGTAFGAYDAAIIAAVQQRWYNLLDERGVGYERSGRVVIEFRLNHDGRVTQIQVGASQVGDYLAFLCRKAVEDPAPYAPWPGDMRLMHKQDYRDVRFTFHYN